MPIESITAQIVGLRQRRHARGSSNLHELAENEARLPDFVHQSPVAMRYLRLLGPLTWDCFPERDLTLGWPVEPVPYAALAPAYLIKLDQEGLATVSALRRYLVEALNQPPSTPEAAPTHGQLPIQRSKPTELTVRSAASPISRQT